MSQKELNFPVQTYPCNLQCLVFENMLSQLNTYQKNFFEDEQNKYKEEIKRIGVLRYQITCFMIKHLFEHSIKPKKIPNSMAAIRDILYRGILFIPFSKVIKMNEFELLKSALKYKLVTDAINEKTKIFKTFSHITQKNKTKILQQINNKKFNFPNRPHFTKTITNIDLEQNQIIIPGKTNDIFLLYSVLTGCFGSALLVTYLLSND